MKKYLFALIGVLAVLAIPATGRAARVEADPNREYVISPDAGPFAILVKAYMGEDARRLANRLTLHLRQNGWPAYVFDYTAEERRQAQELLDARYKDIPPEQRHKTIRIQEQWGVFIGGYRSFDAAADDLPKVKQLPEPPTDSNVLYVDHVDPQTGRLYTLNTYAMAMATRNPTVRAQRRDPSVADPVWKGLNEGRPYNLMKCPQEWTLVVKQFQGAGVVQPRSESSDFLSKLGFGDKSNDLLTASRKQAEEMARWIREAWQLDAYVLITQTSSIVTVGGFDRMDDPRLQELSRKLADFAFGPNPDSIRLFHQPMPMRVPRL